MDSRTPPRPPRPPSRWRRASRLLGRTFMLVSTAVLLFDIWDIPGVFALLMFVYGVFLTVLGRPRPMHVPPPTREQRVVIAIGALLTLASPLSMILAFLDLIHGGIGVVGFCTIWLGPMLVSAGSRQPPHPSDKPENPWAILGMGGRR